MQQDLATALADHAAGTDAWRALMRAHQRALSAGQANWRPAPQRWSIAQCLDHVRIVTEAVQARLRAVIEAADGVDLARVRVPSPALALLRLPVGIWLQALPQHTLRHLAQARRVRGDESYPAA